MNVGYSNQDEINHKREKKKVGEVNFGNNSIGFRRKEGRKTDAIPKLYKTGSSIWGKTGIRKVRIHVRE